MQGTQGENSSIRRNGSHDGSISSSVPSLSSLMELLKLKSSTGTSNSDCDYFEPTAQPGRTTLKNNEVFDHTPLQPAHPFKKPRQANPAAASAGRAMLSQTPKSSSDGLLYYEAKTKFDLPQRKNVTRNRSIQQDGAPRKCGSFQGRSRDTFILKIMKMAEKK